MWHNLHLPWSHTTPRAHHSSDSPLLMLNLWYLNFHALPLRPTHRFRCRYFSFDELPKRYPSVWEQYCIFNASSFGNLNWYKKVRTALGLSNVLLCTLVALRTKYLTRSVVYFACCSSNFKPRVGQARSLQTPVMGLNCIPDRYSSQLMVLFGHFRSVVRELIKHIQFETVTSFSTDLFELDQTHLCLVYFILLEYIFIFIILFWI